MGGSWRRTAGRAAATANRTAVGLSTRAPSLGTVCASATDGMAVTHQR